MHTGPGADVKNIVCFANSLFIMLDHDDGIALITQVLECTQQAIIVTLMQTDRGLIQDIENPGQTRPNLGCQTDSLALPTT